MTASDLVGRFLLDKDGTKWQDDPLATAARMGAICYLDEIVEARQRLEQLLLIADRHMDIKDFSA